MHISLKINMRSYKLRIDLSDSITLSRIINIIELYSTEYIHVLEKLEDNPHVHLFFRTDKTVQNLRQSLRNLGLKGNKSYSLKELEEDYPIEYIAYMMKEGELTSVNIPPSILEEATAYNTQVQKSIKEKKEAKKTILQKLLQLVKNTTDNENYPLFVSQTIYNYHIENDLPIRFHQIQVYFDTIMCKTSPSYMEDMVTKTAYPFIRR